MENLISLKIAPEIYQSLEAIKIDLEQRAKEALSVVCTADTVKDVKQLRSDIRKKKESLEAQRKALKIAYMRPYEEFLLLYQTVTSCLDGADIELKQRIESVSAELIQKRIEKLNTFFQEKAKELGVTWVTWESVGCKVVASKSDKHYRETLTLLLENLVRDLAVIDTMPNKDMVSSFFIQHYDLPRAMAETAQQEKQLQTAQACMGQAMVQMQQDNAVEKENQAMAAAQDATVLISEPEVKSEEKQYTLSFTVKNATMDQLKDLKTFLINGGYEYE